MSKRVNAIQEVKESVALLTQLLQDYDSTASDQSNMELIQVSGEAGAHAATTCHGKLTRHLIVFVRTFISAVKK